MSHAYYLDDIVHPKKLTFCAKKIAKEINIDKVDLGINSIAITGVSGSIIGGIISHLTKLPLIIIRKGENCHSIYNIEFDNNIGGGNLQYCIVDDTIDTKKTIKNIMTKISNEGNFNSSLKKIYLYHDSGKYENFCINEGENSISVFNFRMDD